MYMSDPTRNAVQRLFAFLPLLAALAAPAAYGFEDGLGVELESGAVWQSRNDVQSPTRPAGATPAGTRFSLSPLLGGDAEAYGRVRASYTWRDTHQVYVLYAPLTLQGVGTFAAPVSFQGTSFAASVPTQAKYRFDSYRLGYRYHLLQRDIWDLWVGATVKIRDADIALRQGTLSANRANTGPVPLLNLVARAQLAPRWSILLDAEGLAAPQGRAIDAALKLRYAVTDKVGVGAGYRILEGGADNKTVYTFATVHYALVSLDVHF